MQKIDTTGLKGNKLQIANLYNKLHELRFTEEQIDEIFLKGDHTKQERYRAKQFVKKLKNNNR